MTYNLVLIGVHHNPSGPIQAASDWRMSASNEFATKVIVYHLLFQIGEKIQKQRLLVLLINVLE